jgi:hypothetical protein
MLTPKPIRSWQEIAEEASRERNCKKVHELAKELELELALDARDEKRKPQGIPVNRRQQSA